MKTKVMVVLVLCVAVSALAASGEKREIEGTLVSASSTAITVNDTRTRVPVTAKLDFDTVMRHGAFSVSYYELKEGERVHVKARVNDDGSLTAETVLVRERR